MKLKVRGIRECLLECVEFCQNFLNGDQDRSLELEVRESDL